MAKIFSYIVARDFGFAPNPFYNYCTLATCKPKIRHYAKIGDWIIGTGSKKNNMSGYLVFAMKVSEKITYNQYWEDHRFESKKPFMNGSLKQMYGDNIYHYDYNEKQWIQSDSHHSNEDGTINYLNVKRDTQTDNVLIAEEFYYFGKEAKKIPIELSNEVCMIGQGHKYLKPEICIKLIKWLKVNYTHGLNAEPLLFKDNFERYKGQKNGK